VIGDLLRDRPGVPRSVHVDDAHPHQASMAHLILREQAVAFEAVALRQIGVTDYRAVRAAAYKIKSCSRPDGLTIWR
jgi:hypothetical protein